MGTVYLDAEYLNLDILHKNEQYMTNKHAQLHIQKNHCQQKKKKCSHS